MIDRGLQVMQKINFSDNRKDTGKCFMPLYAAAILLFILSIIPLKAHAEPDWQVALTVRSGVAYNRLVLGADSSATDGYDAIWDTYALLGGTVEAQFPHPEWGLAQQEFQRDILAHNTGTVIEWAMTVNSTLINGAFTVTWGLASIPQENALMLIDDSSGQQTDMRTNSSYNFIYTGPRSFRIAVTETSSCSRLPVRIAGGTTVYYPTLMDAYVAAGDGDTIELLSGTITGDYIINLNKPVTFSGGYNCSYTSQSGNTIINGNLQILSGSVSIENLLIQ